MDRTNALGPSHPPESRRSRQARICGLVAVLSVAVICSPSPRTEARSTVPVAVPADSDAPYDAAATDVARALAGLEPSPGPLFSRVTSRLAWQVHRAVLDSEWSRFETDRIAKMRAWRDRELKTAAGTCDTLFYPFGGPDFVNAFVLFPGCNRYLLFGLEQVGSIPPLDRAGDEKFDRVLSGLRDAISDIFVRDYFITNSMMTHLRTPEIDGTLPLMLVFLARLGGRVVDVRMEGPWDAPEAAPGESAALRPARTQARRSSAVIIRFRMPGASRVQTLCYARVRMEDREFEKQAPVLAYLERTAPFTTFLKSASYLMHDDRFSQVRSLILNRSRFVLEDDSGVPYRYFDKTGWDVTLFGRYSPPVKDFNYGLQRDLEAAYRDPSVARDLPFSFGYHWRDGTSSVILAVRRGAVP
jgi:hypothetical protein